MQFKFQLNKILSVSLIGLWAVTNNVYAEKSATTEEKHEHAHEHEEADKSEAQKIYDGYFEDSQIEERTLSDWSGDWQSVYPYLVDGTLAPVMEEKAKKGDKTAEEYTQYYDTGYKTDVNRIVIEDNGKVTFYRNDNSESGEYVSDGYEILTYSKGNRGVRYSFKKAAGDESAPQYIQFSDHHISPNKVDHYHLYWGDDREAVLAELTNWPTYYFSALSGEEILQEMLAH